MAPHVNSMNRNTIQGTTSLWDLTATSFDSLSTSSPDFPAIEGPCLPRIDPSLIISDQIVVFSMRDEHLVASFTLIYLIPGPEFPKMLLEDIWESIKSSRLESRVDLPLH